MIALSGANRITAPVATRAVSTMLAISQKPDRVSNILRSSTPASRVKGMAAGAGRAVSSAVVGRSIVVVLMPLLLLVGSPR